MLRTPACHRFVCRQMHLAPWTPAPKEEELFLLLLEGKTSTQEYKGGCSNNYWSAAIGVPVLGIVEHRQRLQSPDSGIKTRERERQTDRQTETERERERQRETERQTDRERETERVRDRERETKTERERETERERQTETE